MQLIVGDEDAKCVAQYLAQHLCAFDLGADRSAGLDEGRRWSGENDLIAAFEDRLPLRFDVAAVADNTSKGDTLADMIFDCADRLPGSRGDPIGPCLEFLVTQVSGLAGFGSGKSRLQLGGFFLGSTPISQGAAKGTKSNVRM